MPVVAALGLGLAILAVTRPFEGVAYATPLMAMLAWQYRARFPALLRIAVPALILTGAALAGLGVYLKAVTGSPFVTAYHISQEDLRMAHGAGVDSAAPHPESPPRDGQLL